MSCSPTNGEVIGDSSLAPNGLSLTDDGRVFFDSTDAIALLDSNGRKDVYEWEPPGTGNCVASNNNPNYFAFTGNCLSLISAGLEPPRFSTAFGQRRRHRRLLLHPRFACP